LGLEKAGFEFNAKGIKVDRHLRTTTRNILAADHVNNIVFSCGAILEDDGKELKIYYGASDTSICV